MNTKIMKTMDGNEAAAYISYAFTAGLQTARRTSLVRQYVW